MFEKENKARLNRGIIPQIPCAGSLLLPFLQMRCSRSSFPQIQIQHLRLPEAPSAWWRSWKWPGVCIRIAFLTQPVDPLPE